ncbi:hypothetical protein E1287_18315 [Actinomadura sp. KC06]|uniref:hypothetical protein n=1 Tax=Actinomadura sp. KC06 TaxID=2530369 RepID=UPI001047F8D6|nr:hypothetical protein [Actinomadura sp. KC06]TDD33899.1 hypothetical protein E1287_18315 [Actinomadura sp. KC06]
MDDRLSMPRDRVPSSMARRTFTIPPGASREYVSADWQDALVIVERGSIEVEAVDGVRQRFDRGDVLTLSELPLRTLHGLGPETAVLTVIFRRSGPNSAADR